MSGKIVLDSVIIIDIANCEIDDETLQRLCNRNKLYVSVITHIEALASSKITAREEQRIKAVLKKCRSIPVNRKIRDCTIAFRKATRCKLPDSIIAATAINLGATLLTRDNVLLDADFPQYTVMGLSSSQAASPDKTPAS